MGWWFPLYGAFFHGSYQQPVDAGDRGRLDGVDVELLEEPEGRSVGPLGLPLFCRAAQPWHAVADGGTWKMSEIKQPRHPIRKTGRGFEQVCGYGSIPINTIFRGMNIHKSQLFWCELQGYYWFWHTAICFRDVQRILVRLKKRGRTKACHRGWHIYHPIIKHGWLLNPL